MDIKNKNYLGGIYSITNIINNKKYIGSSTNIKKRWKEHIYYLNNGLGINKHIQHSWNKYGGNNFKFQVEEYCPQSLLILKEKYYIYKYNTMDEKFGYNFNEPVPSKMKLYPEHKDLKEYGGIEPTNIEKYIVSNNPFKYFKEDENLSRLYLEYCFLYSIKDEFVKNLLWNNSGYLKYKSGFESMHSLNTAVKYLSELKMNKLDNFEVTKIFKVKEQLENTDLSKIFMLKDIKEINIYNKKIPVDITNLFNNIGVKEKRKRNNNENSLKLFCGLYILYNNIEDKDYLELLCLNNIVGFCNFCGIHTLHKEELINGINEFKKEILSLKCKDFIEVDILDIGTWSLKQLRGVFTCQRCKKEFPYLSYNKQEKNRKYCKYCSRIVHNGAFDGDVKYIKCIDCGKEVQIKLTDSKTTRCQECKKEHNRIRSREYTRKYRNEKKSKII